MRKHKRLTDAYQFPGWTPLQTVRGVLSDPKARVIQFTRRQKKTVLQSAANRRGAFTATRCDVSTYFRVATGASMWNWKFDASGVGGARR